MVGLLLALACLGGGAYTWFDEAPLRDHGVGVTARVISAEDGAALVEFTDQQGRSIQAHLDSFSTPKAGGTVVVVFDPDDPEQVVLADEFQSPLGYIPVVASALALLAVAALTWTRVIDWQHVSDWVHN